MSFVRPELAHRFKTWREAIVWAVVLIVGLWLVWQGYRWLAPLYLLLGLILAVFGFGLLRAAVRRQRLARGVGPGEVLIDEGRIGFFGPGGGGFLDRDALARVDLVIDPDATWGDASWRFTAEDGQRLTVPLGAHGAPAIYDMLASLPGLTDGAAMASLAQGRAGTFLVWRRSP